MYILQGITNRQVSVFYQGRDTARLFCNKKPACSQFKYFAFWIEPVLALLSDLLIREDFPSPPVLQLIRPEVWGNSECGQESKSESGCKPSLQRACQQIKKKNHWSKHRKTWYYKGHLAFGFLYHKPFFCYL